MIKAVLIGGDKLQEWLKGQYPAIQNRIGQSMARLVITLTRKIKEEKLTGQVLKNKTGTLRRSISPEVSQSGTNLTGTVGTNIVYARIHEYGGTTKPHDIIPTHRQALMWAKASFIGPIRMTKAGKFARRQGSEPFQFAKVVHHPGSKIPERSFMRTALREMEPEIRAQFENAITEVIGGRF